MTVTIIVCSLISYWSLCVYQEVHYFTNHCSGDFGWFLCETADMDRVTGFFKGVWLIAALLFGIIALAPLACPCRLGYTAWTWWKTKSQNGGETK